MTLNKSFNGATLSRTWKRGFLCTPIRPTSRFNGATLSRTWKLARHQDQHGNEIVLQWSHAQPNVETIDHL